MGEGLLALGSVETEVVGSTGYSARAPLGGSQLRIPGNSRKGLILKIGFLSRRLCAQFVQMGPGLPSSFKNLSRCPDEGIFLPSHVQIGGSGLSAGSNDIESFPESRK